MANGIRLKIDDNFYISLIQVDKHEKNKLGVKGIREEGSVEAAIIIVDQQGNSNGIVGQVVRLSDASELIEFINEKK